MKAADPTIDSTKRVVIDLEAVPIFRVMTPPLASAL